MYQALYRKYRPQNFDEVFGQDVVIKTLRNSIENDKISHAYLFSGPRGCGKTSIAKIFARMVNCKNLENHNLCGKCVCCTQNNEQNMDIIEMDAASNNGVDEIREINNKVNLVPTLGKYKIYIIDEVHMLTIGAFNALLKTLEEPPSHVIFILATTDPHKVPITILSRCQRFDFKKISEEKIFERLKYICDMENISIEEEALWEISRNGDGSLRDATSILDQVVAYTDEKITIKEVHDVNGTISQKNISELIEALLEGNLGNIISKITDYSNKGKSIIKITEEIILYLRNLILMKTDPKILEVVLEVPKIVIEQLTIEELLDYIKIMNQTLLDMKKFANTKMLLEMSFIKILNLRNSENMSNLELPKKQIIQEENKQNLKLENQIVSEVKLEEVKLDKKEKLNQINKKVEKNINLSMENNLAYDELKKFIDRRVANTLARFSKTLTIEMKKNIGNLREYLMDEKFSKYAEIVLDGELKASSNEYAIFTFNTESLSFQFNEELENIELLIEKILNNKYKLIAVDIEKWNIIKENFNLKKQKYEYEEETQNISEILKKLNVEDTDEMKSLFGEILEYN